MMHDCQPQSRFAILRIHPGTISLIEAFPNFFCLLLGHSNPIILNCKLGPFWQSPTSNFDLIIFGKLNGILDNIKHNLHKSVIVGINT